MIPTLQEIIIIDEILAESSAAGLRKEVIEAAQQIWNDNEDESFTLLDAYHKAYRDLIN